MARGGARNRSGPPKDPTSSRSTRLKVDLKSLPAEGWKGRPPAYPLAPRPLIVYIEGVPVEDAKLSKAFRSREIELWRELWKTPQAAAWSLPENHFRHRIVANYCRLSVRCEDPGASPSLLSQLHRFADQVGLTTAGLREMGWDIAASADIVTAPQTPETSTEPTPDAPKPARERSGLKLVSDGGA